MDKSNFSQGSLLYMYVGWMYSVWTVTQIPSADKDPLAFQEPESSLNLNWTTLSVISHICIGTRVFRYKLINPLFVNLMWIPDLPSVNGLLGKWEMQTKDVESNVSFFFCTLSEFQEFQTLLGMSDGSDISLHLSFRNSICRYKE